MPTVVATPSAAAVVPVVVAKAAAARRKPIIQQNLDRSKILTKPPPPPTSPRQKQQQQRQSHSSSPRRIRIEVHFHQWLTYRKEHQWKKLYRHRLRRLYRDRRDCELRRQKRKEGQVVFVSTLDVRHDDNNNDNESCSSRPQFHINVNFHEWLKYRKEHEWKKLHHHRRQDRELVLLEKQKKMSSEGGQYLSTTTTNGGTTNIGNHLLLTKLKTAPILPPDWRNPLFKCPDTGLGLPYDDNWEFTPEEGSRADLFIQPITDFPQWLKSRKEEWRRTYKVHKLVDNLVEDDDDYSMLSDDEFASSEITTVPHDFWRTCQGYATFDDWLTDSIVRWKKSYSWNQQKRKKIQQECEEVVHLPSMEMAAQDQQEEFYKWLRIRKFQWRISRRKRQRQRLESEDVSHQAEEELAELTSSAEGIACTSAKDIRKRKFVAPIPGGEEMDNLGLGASLDVSATNSSCVRLVKRSKHSLTSSNAVSRDLVAIDDLLDYEERQKKEKGERPPLDIELLFDPNNGVPDDVLVHCFAFLDQVEHYKLLFINRATAKSLQDRGEQLWRQVS